MLEQWKLTMQVLQHNSYQAIKERMAYDVKALLELDGYKCDIIKDGKKLKIKPTEQLTEEEQKEFDELKAMYTEDCRYKEKQNLKEMRKAIIGK